MMRAVMYQVFDASKLRISITYTSYHYQHPHAMTSALLPINAKTAVIVGCKRHARSQNAGKEVIKGNSTQLHMWVRKNGYATTIVEARSFTGMCGIGR